MKGKWQSNTKAMTNSEQQLICEHKQKPETYIKTNNTI